MFSFDNTYARLPQRFHRPAKPAAARAPQLIRFNQALAEELGLDVADVDSERLAQLFGGQVIPVGAEPLAQAYAGHQFGHFNPQLGDGRALLLGEVLDRNGTRPLRIVWNEPVHPRFQTVSLERQIPVRRLGTAILERVVPASVSGLAEYSISPLNVHYGLTFPAEAANFN